MNDANSRIEDSLLASFLLPIAQALRVYGVDPMQVFEDVAVDPAIVINADRRIPSEQLFELLRHCVELTGDEAFGLVAADSLQPQMLHSLGLAWLASDTVYDGLKRLVRFGQLVNTHAVLSLQERGEFVYMYRHTPAPAANYTPVAADYAMGVIIRMSHLTLGEYLAPVSVQLQRPQPAQAERWEQALSSRVVFDGDVDFLQFSLSDITEPLLTGDPALARINDDQTELYLAGFLSRQTAREVVEKIVEHLPDGPPSQDRIASQLHVSNRTLQRKLKEEGTTFLDLLQDTRLQLARTYLHQPGKSIVEIAYQLGFSEPSTFSRAFKRWTGKAPADYRAEAESGAIAS
jgi:AraC-like DNA-binding protein